MTYPSGLIRAEAAAVAHEFGVALDQVHRDHLISSILAALQAHADELVFFGGTALARTYLRSGRLSEDVDLIAVTDRGSVARSITRTIDRALRVTHGRVDWTVDLAGIRDTEPASLITGDGLIVRVQLLRAGLLTLADHRAAQLPALQDITPTRLRTPTRDSFAAWKSAAWVERHAPRDLYDLRALALAGALTSSAARLFAVHTDVGTPQDHMFTPAPTAQNGASRCPDRHGWPSVPRRRCRSSAQRGPAPDPDVRRSPDPNGRFRARYVPVATARRGYQGGTAVSTTSL